MSSMLDSALAELRNTISHVKSGFQPPPGPAPAPQPQMDPAQMAAMQMQPPPGGPAPAPQPQMDPAQMAAAQPAPPGPDIVAGIQELAATLEKLIPVIESTTQKVQALEGNHGKLREDMAATRALADSAMRDLKRFQETPAPLEPQVVV